MRVQWLLEHASGTGEKKQCVPQGAGFKLAAQSSATKVIATCRWQALCDRAGYPYNHHVSPGQISPSLRLGHHFSSESDAYVSPTRRLRRTSDKGEGNKSHAAAVDSSHIFEGPCVEINVHCWILIDDVENDGLLYCGTNVTQ